MSLRSTFDRLVAQARAGGRAEAELAGGAIIRVRAEPGSARVMLIISRIGMPVGDVEIETFKDHCRIPPDAERRPAIGQDYIAEERRHRVAFVWERPRELFDDALFGE